MSRQVDERVVSMQFDNRQFERNVSTTMSTLDKLKQRLNLTGATKGLENIDAASRKVNMSALGSAVETVAAKFSALQVMGVTALANITNSAINTGKRMISALTIDPIKTGFQEYETKMNAIQTIMSNTASKGTTMEDVTRVIGELNTYADKTIYNFAEMTRNIGTFTAAGVGLEESATAIQGIANLAAMSGSNSQQASTAMYQLSQAMASGTVKLMDWNSVVNAGMGGELFQNALKETARAHGVAVDDMIKKSGSFRESLSKGWITTEILTETLSKMTKSGAAEYLSNLTGIEQEQIESIQKLVDENKDGTASYDELAEQLAATGKVSKEEALSILQMADNAEDAATKVKTFTQLWDTLKESAQSGWSQTWEILVGDFEEAKETLTEISKVIGGVIEASANARNELLQGWKDAGGRADLVESLFNIFKAIGSYVKPIKEAFRDIFPPITVENLKNMTEKLKEFTANLALSSENGEKVKRIFKGLFSILSIGIKIVKSITNAFFKLAGSDGIGNLATFLLDTAAAIGDFFTSLNEGFDSNGLTGLLSKFVSLVSDILGTAVGHINSFSDAVSSVGNFILKVLSKVWEGIKTVFTWIADNVSAGDIFAGLAGGGIFIAAKKISGFLDKIIETIKGLFGKGEKDNVPGIIDHLKDVLGSLKDTLNSFATGIKVSSILSIAIAVGILSASLKTISELDAQNIVKSLFAIGIMMGMLTGVMKSITKTLDKFGGKGLTKAGFSLILVAAAIKILASAMEKMSKLSLKDIAKGLVGIGGGLVELSLGLKIIGKTKISLKTSIAIIALAKACEILGDALWKFSRLTWDEIGRGLSAMGGALTELVIAVSVLKKAGGFKSLFGSLGILIIVQSLDEMAEGLKKFAEMSWDEIKRGLAAMGGALGELTAALTIVGKVAGFSSIFAAGAIWIVVQGLDDIAKALKKFSKLSWDEIGRGLSAMGGALLEVGGITGAVGKLAGLSGIFGAGTILIVIQGLDDLVSALKKFAQMTWDEIGRGLSAMGGALLEVGGISGALGKIAGLSGIFGAGTILIVIQGLDDLANALQKFGSMTWDEIGRGLVAMGGALLEVGAISGALGAIAGLSAILGGAAIWVAVQGLDDLATSLKKFGEMSWDEIGRGLTAMGSALGELALGGFLNTLSIIGSFSISEMAVSLGDLADSVKKWCDVTIPEGLGTQLGALADGVNKFTLAGAGSSNISKVAIPLGDMADSVKKWKDVTIPEGLGNKLDSLSNGVKKFWDAGIGANGLATAAVPLGDMADSVKKWNGVTVPENMESDLTALSNGIKSFSFAFAGGWSMNALISPLANLPDSIKKWTGITIPEELESQLKSLARGVLSFSFAFAGGWSLEAIITPLANLSDSVKKWNGVTIPEDLGPSLSSLADGIRPFGTIGDISYSANSVGSFVTSIQTLSGVDISSIAASITTLGPAITNLGSAISANIDTISSLGNTIVDGIVTPISNSTTRIYTAGLDLIQSFINGIDFKKAGASESMNSICSELQSKISEQKDNFKTKGSELMDKLGSGITSKETDVKSDVGTVMDGAADEVDDYYQNFYDAGAYCIEGLAQAMEDNAYLAASAGTTIASVALEAAKRALRENSPSKAFYELGDYGVIGFVNAFHDGIRSSCSAGSEIANSAIDGLSNAISQIGNIVDSEIDYNPTIRPVLDLSNIRNGANSINGMFARQTVALAGINADYANIDSKIGLNDMLIQMQKSNSDSNREVVSAISNLRGDFSSLVKAINGMQIRMDSGTVVGELIGKIDNSLGQIASYKGRGN